MPDLPLQITAGALPLNYAWTPQAFFDAMVERMTVSTGQAYSLFTSGAVLPSSDTGPHFLTTESTWYYFDYDTGDYQPIALNSKSLRYIISATAPSNLDYDIWYRIAEDGTPLDIRKYQAGQWVAFPVDYANVANKPNLTPIGVIHEWPTGTAPADFLICNGAAVLRGEYSALFAILGTTYGSGDGSTTFNLPDYRGRTSSGAGTGDATDATAWSLGVKRGTEGVSLTAAQMPAHTHTGLVNNPGTTAAFTGGGPVNDTEAGVTGITGGDAVTVGTVTAHSNIQPSICVNRIIRYR